MSKRSRWYKAEELVKQKYISQWRTFEKSNFTIRWGEIDLIFSNTTNIVFVEVKDVTHTDDILWYISQKKRDALHKTLDTYMWRYPTSLQPRVDFVFVKSDSIYTVIENCIDF